LNINFGEVIFKIEDLPLAFEKAAKLFADTYKPIQQIITKENVYTEEGSTATERASIAIQQYLDVESNKL